MERATPLPSRFSMPQPPHGFCRYGPVGSMRRYATAAFLISRSAGTSASCAATSRTGSSRDESENGSLLAFHDGPDSAANCGSSFETRAVPAKGWPIGTDSLGSDGPKDEKLAVASTDADEAIATATAN